jgi:hypothetical protein
MNPFGVHSAHHPLGGDLRAKVDVSFFKRKILLKEAREYREGDRKKNMRIE